MKKKLLIISIIFLSIVVLSIAILFFAGVGSSEVLFPYMFTALSIQQVLLGIANYKHSKKTAIFSFISAFIILFVIIIVLFVL